MTSKSCRLHCNQYWASSSFLNRYDVHAIFRNIEEPMSPKMSSLMLDADEVIKRDPTEVRLSQHSLLACRHFRVWFVILLYYLFSALIDPENQQLVSILQRVCWEYRLWHGSLCRVRPKERVLRWGIPPLLFPGICQHVSQTRSRCVWNYKNSKWFQEHNRLGSNDSVLESIS